MQREEDITNSLASFGSFFLSVLGLSVTAAVKGFVFSTLWGWFFVTSFGLPELPIIPAIGVALVVTYLTSTSRISDDAKEKKSKEYLAQSMLEGMGRAILYGAIVLGMGYILHLLM